MKTTYFFGAGASYKAIPIVGELDKAFEEINLQTSQLLSHFERLKLLSQFKIFQAHMLTGARASKSFGTIDTYAKHLWLTNDFDLKALKESLSFFFTVWQELDKSYFNQAKIRSEPFLDVDPRYLGLLANYLGKTDGNITLNPDVKFLTWNYDSQIERALSLFTGTNNIEYALEKFKIYPYNYRADYNPNVVHLNGIAGLYAEKGNSTKTFFRVGNQSNKIEDVFENSLHTLNSRTISNNKYFSFAWEEDDFSLNAIKHSEKILHDSNIVVIIGYSFPSFNDQVDKQLMKVLSASSNFKRIYYQDPNASKELLLTRFGIPEDKITIIKQTNQFILPLDSHTLNLPTNQFEMFT